MPEKKIQIELNQSDVIMFDDERYLIVRKSGDITGTYDTPIDLISIGLSRFKDSLDLVCDDDKEKIGIIEDKMNGLKEILNIYKNPSGLLLPDGIIL
jgi:hypothetical protein